MARWNLRIKSGDLVDNIVFESDLSNTELVNTLLTYPREAVIRVITDKKSLVWNPLSIDMLTLENLDILGIK